MESTVEQESMAVLVIEPRTGYVQVGWRELWAARELLYFLAWRDLKTRYAQTAIGAGWALMQPLLSTLIFTLVFSYLAKVPSDGLPYPLFAFAAILPWSLFARSLERSTLSVVTEGGLIKKVYFPRLIIPIAATFINLVDFTVGLLILMGMMTWYQVLPQWTVSVSASVRSCRTAHGVVGKSVAVGPQCEISRCGFGRPIGDAVVDVRLSGALPSISGTRVAPVVLRFKSYGRCD
jgi:uncharacterized membrane protein YhdT